MVTLDRIRAAWQAIVEAHVSDVAFVSIWNPALDDPENLDFPACIWRPNSGSMTITDAHSFQDVFNLSMSFVDQTASDRSQDERDRAHDRMDAVARQCWQKFATDYVVGTGVVQGVTFDFQQDAVPTFTPVYDEGPKQLTGVVLEVTLTSNAPSYCLTDYFVND